MTDVTGREPTRARPRSHTSGARAYVRWGLLASAVAVCLPAARDLVAGGRPAAASAVLALLVAGAVVAHVRTLGRALDGPVSAVLPLPVLAAALAVLGVLVLVEPLRALGWTMVAGCAASALLLSRERRARTLLGIAGLAVLIGVAFGTVGSPAPLPPVVRATAAALAFLIPLTIDASMFWLWRIVQRLDTARRLADELATSRERARIAAELHDVQGQSLHVIAMRAELVERLVLDDPAAAAEHARIVRTLAAGALAETRSLVHGYRVGDVAAEVSNAADLLRAAGARTVVRGDPAGIRTADAAVFAPLVREATTNILRHSVPLHVEITVERDVHALSLHVVNDGASGDRGSGAGGTGIAGLRERFERRGGSLIVDDSESDRWRLTGTVPIPASQGD